MNTLSPDANDIKVSVCMITYNHERFIAQAIESVLMQETDFPVELVIGEDCSTDGTRAIVREFGERFSERIRLLLPEHNLGMMPNFVATLSACRGQYVALLEGDDYWTDQHKLQKQVDYLEDRPKCSLCFHNAIMQWENGSGETRFRCRPDMKAQLSIEDILATNMIPTCSVVFRNGLIGEMPEWFYDHIMGDWPLWVLLAQHGKLGYINEVMGVYRIHRGGIWSGGNYLEQLRGWFKVYDAVDRHLGFVYHDSVEQAKVNYSLAAADEYFVQEKSSMLVSQPTEALMVFSHEYLGDDSRIVKKFIAQYHARSFFEAAQKQDYLTVKRMLPRLARHNPSVFRNRGARSVTAQALFGERVVTVLRRIVQRAGV